MFWSTCIMEMVLAERGEHDEVCNFKTFLFAESVSIFINFHI